MQRWNPGAIQDPAGVRNRSESTGNRWWVQDGMGGWERKPEQQESTAYIQQGGLGGATEAQVREKKGSLGRWRRRSKVTDWEEQIPLKSTTYLIILIIITMDEKTDVMQLKWWILPLSDALAAPALVTDVIHSGYWPDAQTGSIICFLVPLHWRCCPVCICTHSTQYSSVHTVTT